MTEHAPAPFYLVWNENTGYTMYKHPGFNAAQLEAIRLSRAHPGQRFHVLTSHGYAVKDEVHWQAIDTDLPF